MEDFLKIRADFKTAVANFKTETESMFKSFESEETQNKGTVKIDDLLKYPSDFGLGYCLSESIKQVERCISENPSRELSIIKTKLQEAYFWACEV